MLSLHADGQFESGSCRMILNHHVKQRETRHADLTSMISCDIIDNVKQGKGMKTLFDVVSARKPGILMPLRVFAMSDLHMIVIMCYDCFHN